MCVCAYMDVHRLTKAGMGECYGCMLLLVATEGHACCAQGLFLARRAFCPVSHGPMPGGIGGLHLPPTLNTRSPQIQLCRLVALPSFKLDTVSHHHAYSSCILCHIILHTMSHHLAYYVTSSCIVCHIILHTMSQCPHSNCNGQWQRKTHLPMSQSTRCASARSLGDDAHVHTLAVVRSLPRRRSGHIPGACHRAGSHRVLR